MTTHKGSNWGKPRARPLPGRYPDFNATGLDDDRPRFRRGDRVMVETRIWLIGQADYTVHHPEDLIPQPGNADAASIPVLRTAMVLSCTRRDVSILYLDTKQRDDFASLPAASTFIRLATDWNVLDGMSFDQIRNLPMIVDPSRITGVKESGVVYREEGRDYRVVGIRDKWFRVRCDG